MIVEAVVVGAAAGASATATTAVTDAYSALKDGVRRLLQRGSADTEGDESEDLVTAIEADPESERDALREALTAADADQDTELVAAARRVLTLVDPDGARAGKYRVELRDNTGVQVGDGNTMTLNLGDSPARRR